jgi:hypothetical protein
MSFIQARFLSHPFFRNRCEDRPVDNAASSSRNRSRFSPTHIYGTRVNLREAIFQRGKSKSIELRPIEGLAGWLGWRRRRDSRVATRNVHSFHLQPANVLANLLRHEDRTFFCQVAGVKLQGDTVRRKFIARVRPAQRLIEGNVIHALLPGQSRHCVV